jgi:hypothetical protein
MKKLQPPLRALGLGLLILAAGACFQVQVIKDSREADRAFREAYQEVERLEAVPPLRRGRAQEVCVLVFDRQARELVRVEVPFWLAKACLDLGLSVAEHDHSFGFEERYGFDWRKFRELDRFGPGLLVSVDDEESQVLVWLR